jgi:hypothetical protein
MQTSTLQQTRDKISFLFLFFSIILGRKKWKNQLQRDKISLKLIRTAQQRP